MHTISIPLSKFNYTFKKKPLLVGGKAMEYYGLRLSGKDIDFIADEYDVLELIKLYPNRVKNIYYDLGVCPFEFEIWRTIQMLDYYDLKIGAIEHEDYLIISLEKLLLMKTLGMKEEKYRKDTELILKKISENQYKDYETQKKHVEALLSGIENIQYLEKIGP